MAGLVMNGSADVSISNSSFTWNLRGSWHGAAIVVGGRATVRVAGTVFANNSAENRGNDAGARACACVRVFAHVSAALCVQNTVRALGHRSMLRVACPGHTCAVCWRTTWTLPCVPDMTCVACCPATSICLQEP